MHTLNTHTQVMGHFAAKLDPLELDKRKPPAELDPAYWGFTDKDLDRECVFCFFFLFCLSSCCVPADEAGRCVQSLLAM